MSSSSSASSPRIATSSTADRPGGIDAHASRGNTPAATQAAARSAQRDATRGRQASGGRARLARRLPPNRFVKCARFAAVLVCAIGCGGPTIPRPPMVGQRTSDLVEVPFPPPPARPEYVPARPHDDAVWIDGEWSFGARVWSWRYGRWVIPPKEAKYSPWSTVRGLDGTLWFAAGTWRSVEGDAIPPPRPLARGRATEEDVVEDEGVLED